MSHFAIIGFQRSGTTVLSKLLSRMPEIFVAAEIFHPNAEPAESYFDFLRSFSFGDSTCFHDLKADAYRRFVDHLRASKQRTIIGVNVKYSSCHSLDGAWKALTQRPVLLDVLESLGGGIIHIVRRNIFENALSEARAAQSGTWHVPVSAEYAIQPMRVEPTAILKRMELILREREAFRSYSRNYPYLVELDYEDLFEEGQLSYGARGRIESLLGVVDWDQNLRPELKKLAPPNWRDAVSNWEELEAFLVREGFESML